jgi:hypothetical protein
MSPREAVLFGGFYVAFILAVACYGTRTHPEDFKLNRVSRITLLCLATSLPFACLAYLLWPWDFQSWRVQADILLTVLTPLFSAFLLGYARKRKMLKK